ncbi:MAG TPA: hypothetical protein QKA08_05400, partial [Candidatus Megaira endosymbiont of Nemacystus decipiens]|nr:hypothetical protein [Candidatus Megaera endosymbiont of Nemacystus decipiens]
MPNSNNIIKALSKPYYASDLEHALLSSYNYMESSEGSMVAFPASSTKSKYNQHLKNWHVAKIFFSSTNSCDYYSKLYINDKDSHAVLAHRGTQINKIFSILGTEAKKTDLIEKLNKNIINQQIATYLATRDAIKFLTEFTNGTESYHFSITGHSLGGLFAELSLYFCHMDFGYNDVKAVTFDSPGTNAHFKNLKFNISNANTKFNPDLIKLTTYLSIPTLVNISGEHVGEVYRVYPEINNCVTATEGFLNSSSNIYNFPNFLSNKIKDNVYCAYSLLSLTNSTLDQMIDVFDQITELPIKYKKVCDWPLLKHDNSNEISVSNPDIKMLTTHCTSVAIMNVAVKAVAALVSSTATNSLINVIVEFVYGNIALFQICDSFKHIVPETTKTNCLEQGIQNNKKLFHIHYDGNYRVMNTNPNKIISSIISGSTEWCLEKIFRYNINAMSGISKDVINALSVLKQDYHIDRDQGKYIITSDSRPISTLKNELSWLVSYNSELLVKLSNLSDVNVEKIFSNLPKRLALFVGRDEVMKEIDVLLSSNSAVSIGAFAGTGKSSTA